VSTLCNQEAGQIAGAFLRLIKKRLYNSGLKKFTGLARFLNTTQVETLTPRVPDRRIAPVYGPCAVRAPGQRMK
jgi:hypothetical protein